MDERTSPASLGARVAGAPATGATVVYTDGACLGNPGPGGWAWAVPDGRWRSGPDAHATNQRMELTAVLDAVRSIEGPLVVVSDSTYVVNCFRDGWWEGWLARGWVGKNRQRVANQDLWKPLVEEYRASPGRLRFRWVKGHGSDPHNDLVDRLAVAAAVSQRGGEGYEPPEPGLLGPPDTPTGRATSAAQPGAAQPAGASQPARVGQPPRVAQPAGDPVLTGQVLRIPERGSGVLSGLADAPVTLRSGRLDDAEAVLSLWRAAGSVPGRTDDPGPVRALVAHDPDALVVAEANGEVVATVIAAFDGWRGSVYRLAVRPDLRRRGVASALVHEAERRLVARGAKRVGAIVVQEDKAAVAFWDAVGYPRDPRVARHVKNLGPSQ